ncbi:hypothetical protein DB347_09540 [Opitutaceae bacterium EW11]|nr:hypothetical protein DB347_09540 [Opitutaceae bacterium EW11]
MTLADDAQDLERVQREVRNRRALREEAMGAAGVARMPLREDPSWYQGPRSFKVESEMIASASQLFATLTKKEVLVSGAVAKRRVTVVLPTATVDQAVSVFTEAFAGQHVKVVAVGDHLLVLADQAEVR